VAGTCATCRNDAPELFKGECRTCYQFRYRHGVERPEEVVVRHAEKYNDKLSEQELLSRYTYNRGR
jgi:hypothetical protein